VHDAARGETVICWPGEGLSPYVRRFDHRTGRWSPVVKAASLDFRSKWDYHNYPVMVQAPDGHYLIFHARHRRTGHMVKSPAPHTIEGAWTRTEISRDHCAYPAPVVIGKTVYLFYSRDTKYRVPGATRYYCRRPYRVICSQDNGVTWSAPQTLIDPDPEGDDSFGYNEVYLHGFDVEKGRDGKPDRVLLGWELSGGPKGHNVGGRGNFVAFFNTRDRHMYSVAGKDLGTTIDPAEIYEHCAIGELANPDVRLYGRTTFPIAHPDGGPSVLYTVYEEDKKKWTPTIAKWTGSSWSRHGIDTPIPYPTRFKDYQRLADGRCRILGGWNNDIIEWESPDGVSGWKKLREVSLPSINGSEACARAYVENCAAEVRWVAWTYNGKEKLKDYSGRWPVFTFGEPRRR
jgi:hypothetical protein